MSFIKDPRTAENLDLYGVGDMLTHVTVTTEQADKAWALLSRRGALDLAPMLGLAEVTR